MKFNKRAKTPRIIQMEAVECGAASLCIILGYYGRYVPLEEMRVECGVSRDGSNAFNVIKAAKKFGLRGSGYSKTLEQLKSISYPAILFWEYRHYLVLEGFSKNGVYINDPASGPKFIPYDVFESCYSGVVLEFEKTEDFEVGGKRPSTIAAIFERVKKMPKPMVFLIVTGFLLLIPSFAMTAFLKVFLDTFYKGFFNDFKLNFIGAVAITVLFTLVATSLQQFFLNRLNQKLSIQFSSEFLQHLFKMPMNFYSQRFSGEIAYRMTLNDSVVETLTGPVTSAFLNLLLVFFFAIVMISYEPLIASIGIFLGICNLFVMRWVFQVRANAYAAMQQSRGKSVEESISGLQNIETLKSKGLESDFFLKWVGYYTRQLNAIQSIGRKDVFASAVPVLFQSITIAFLLSIGSFKIVSGALSISKLMVLQSLMMYFLQPINQFVQFGALIQNMKIDLDRLKDVLDNKVDPYLLKSSEKTVSKLKGCLEFRNVSFKYAPLSSPVLENVSFILKPGQRIAFVGPSGSGKSTVTRLASGLYQPTEGEILYDGIPIHELSKESFTNSISVVNQEIFLFSGSIRDNLTFWNSSVPDDVLIKSAKDALIHDEISKRPKGYDSILLEEGRNLSGGERQRLEIARALIYNPSLIILDEATSALDSKLETIFSEKLRQRGCSALMVAHRLSTIRDCDEIIVLNKGVIAERGTHEELKSIGGIYSELINNA